MGTGRTMAQAVNRHRPTVQTRVRSQVSGCDICGGQGGAGTDFFPSASVFPFLYLSTNTPYSCSEKHGCFEKSNTCSGIGEHWTEKKFHSGYRMVFPQNKAHLA